jgi:hypothetical protein
LLIGVTGDAAQFSSLDGALIWGSAYGEDGSVLLGFDDV